MYVTPAGLPSTISAGPNAPVVPGTGRSAWTTASPVRAMAKSEECIVYLVWFCSGPRDTFLSAKSLGLGRRNMVLFLKY